jgi:hypothetical protein
MPWAVQVRIATNMPHIHICKLRSRLNINVNKPVLTLHVGTFTTASVYDTTLS